MEIESIKSGKEENMEGSRPWEFLLELGHEDKWMKSTSVAYMWKEN